MKPVEKLLKKLIDKMVEKYGVDFEYIMDHQHFDGVPWYQHYTMTMEETAAFKLWAVNEIKKHYKSSKAHAEKQFVLFDLNWGLKIEE